MPLDPNPSIYSLFNLPTMCQMLTNGFAALKEVLFFMLTSKSNIPFGHWLSPMVMVLDSIQNLSGQVSNTNCLILFNFDLTNFLIDMNAIDLSLNFRE